MFVKVGTLKEDNINPSGLSNFKVNTIVSKVTKKRYSEAEAPEQL